MLYSVSWKDKNHHIIVKTILCKLITVNYNNTFYTISLWLLTLIIWKFVIKYYIHRHVDTSIPSM